MREPNLAIATRSAPHPAPDSASAPSPAPSRRPSSSAPRMAALDAFRGIAIAGMILVNSPGASGHRYAQLRHAEWNGWTLADLIFPSFLFIVGIASTLSLLDARRRGVERRELVVKILRRTVAIFLVGLFLNAFPTFHWASLRIPGVLQRIAICYCVAGVLVLTTRPIAQSLIAAALLAGYWALLRAAGIAGDGAWLGTDTNLAALVDHALLPSHLLHPSWDPEGLLSTLPAIATTLIGVVTGHWLRWPRSHVERVAGMLAVGNLALYGGLLLGVWFPINKSLWTSSFAIFAAGVALVVLGMCAWLIDLRHHRAWAHPFIVYGSNPLLAYVLSSLVDKTLQSLVVTGPNGAPMVLKQFLYSTLFARFLSAPHASFAWAATYVILWLLPLELLYRKKIFVKL